VGMILGAALSLTDHGTSNTFGVNTSTQTLEIYLVGSGVLGTILGYIIGHDDTYHFTELPITRQQTVLSWLQGKYGGR